MTGRTQQRGIALIMSYLLVAMVTAYGSAMMVQSATEQRSVQRFLRLSAAFQAAEAGLDRALAEFKTNANWTGATYTTTLKGGYDVTVTTLSPTVRQVVATGHYPSNTTTAYGYQHRQVEGAVSVQEALFNYAAFAATTVRLDSASRTDSYDSSLGAYGGSNVGTDGDVGSNSIGTIGTATIRLTSQSHVGGDAMIGPGGNVTTEIFTAGGTTVAGSKQALVSSKDIASKTYPGGSTTNNLVLTSHQQTQLPAGTYTYNYIDMGSYAEVEVTGNATIYVNQYFKMNNNTQFVTASSCPTCTITIYVNGDAYEDAPPAVEFDFDSLLSAGSKPAQLTLYVTGTSASARSVEMGHDVTFSGALHAPLSPVALSGVTVYGAVIGHSIELHASTDIHYDEALASSGVNGGQVQLLSWREL